MKISGFSLLSAATALVLALSSSSSSAVVNAKRSSTKNSRTLSLTSSTNSDRNIRAGSKLGRKLLQSARNLDNNNNQEMNYNFVADYSLKFQGCHHVQQWNDDADDEDDVRVKTKRLARFRLCPSDQCSNTKSTGCTSKFGDYVVDMNTFVNAYMEALEEEKGEICYDAQTDCLEECGGVDDGSGCMEACYDAFDLSFCYNYNNGNNNNDNDNGFDAKEYAECARYELNDGGRRRQLADNQVEYYIGPYCADQGGEIHLGLFTDETCTTYAQNGESMFYQYEGFELPYSDESLISSRCFSCGSYNNNNNGYAQLKEICENIYQYSGKCETRMNVDYPNESSCSYIEGIKIIREDGVIRTSTTKKSKAAAVCIGLFITLAVLLAAYVYYLRTKLGRAQINLAAASQQLT